MICFECIAKEATGYLSGHETGYAAGYNRGYAEGHDSGYTLGLRNNSDTRRIAKACKAAYKHGLEQCAAGPWQPMETIEELEKLPREVDILIRTSSGAIYVAYICNGKWYVSPEEDWRVDYSDVVAWAQINTPEEDETDERI
jgi:hypothetical protein